MPRLDCRGESLDVAQAGAGPTVLLVHSLGTGSWLWREQMAAWASAFTLVAPSARGHHGSTNRGGFALREVAADCLEVARQLGHGSLHLVGISMGGPIVAHMVDLAPDMVASVVIASSFAFQGEAGPKRADVITEAVRTGSMQAYGHRYTQDTLGLATAPEHGVELANSIARMSPDDYVQAARAVFTADVRELYRRIACPARIVVGMQDSRTPPPMSEAIKALVPQADLVTIEDAGHLANLDQPARFAAAVLPFLRTHAAA